MKYLFFFSFIAFMFSCGNDSSDSEMLIGKWKGISWKVNGKESGRDASQVNFDFLPSGSYLAAFGTQSEKGSFHLKGNKLYTHAEGQVEKMVQVILAGTDTLHMDMNRVGTPEVLTLVRQ